MSSVTHGETVLIPSAVMPAPPPRPIGARVTPFEFLTFAEVIARRPQTWLVDGMIPAGGLAILFGKSGTYKTFVALDLALSVATGTAWHGRSVSAGHVAYICAEGDGRMSQRLEAWRSDRGGENDPRLHMLLRGLNLRDEYGITDLRQAIGSQLPEAPQLIVIDTFARCFGGGDENDAGDIMQAVLGIDRLRALGAAILVVHHTGKGGQATPRGSSALESAADTVIHAARDIRSHAVTLTCTKQKDGPEFASVALRAREVGIERGDSSLVLDLATSPISDQPLISTGLSDLDKTILNRLRAQGPLDMKGLRQALAGSEQAYKPISEKKLRRTLKTLDTLGYVSHTKHGQGGRFMYEWAEKRW